MKNYKTKLKHNIVETIVEVIEKCVQMQTDDLEDKLLIAAMQEVRIIMLRKMLQPKIEYAFTFSPVQAIAISIWYTDYLGNYWNNQVTAKLHTISNSIKQTYA
jgi:hypothetical protein